MSQNNEEEKRIQQERMLEILQISQQRKTALEEQLAIDQELQEKQAIALKRQKEIEERIYRLLGDAQRKLKLNPQTKEKRFNEKMSLLKGLRTFVDVEKQISQLNLITDPVIQQQIQQAINRKIMEKNQNQIERQHKLDRQMAQQPTDILQKDLDIFEFDDPVEKQIRLVEVEGNSKKEIKQLAHIIRTKKHLDQVQEIIKPRFEQRAQQQQQLQSPRSTVNIEDEAFFKGVDESLKRREFQGDLQPEQHILQFKVQPPLLPISLLNIGEKESLVPNQKFYEEFVKKSQSMIRLAHQKSIVIFNSPQEEKIKSRSTSLLSDATKSKLVNFSSVRLRTKNRIPVVNQPTRSARSESTKGVLTPLKSNELILIKDLATDRGYSDKQNSPDQVLIREYTPKCIRTKNKKFFSTTIIPNAIQNFQISMNGLMKKVYDFEQESNNQIQGQQAVLSQMNEQLHGHLERYYQKRQHIDPDLEYEKFTLEKTSGKARLYEPKNKLKRERTRQLRVKQIFKSELN